MVTKNVQRHWHGHGHGHGHGYGHGHGHGYIFTIHCKLLYTLYSLNYTKVRYNKDDTTTTCFKT